MRCGPPSHRIRRAPAEAANDDEPGGVDDRARTGDFDPYVRSRTDGLEAFRADLSRGDNDGNVGRAQSWVLRIE